MKSVKWLIDLADGKPLLFSVAILLIGVVTLSSVIQYQNKQINTCNYERQLETLECNRKADSIAFVYRVREYQQNEEVKKILNSIIDTYKKQAEEHTSLDNNINSAIIKTNTQIKKLKDEK